MSKHALQIESGAKQAELHATLKHRDQLKATVAALQKKLKATAASLKASYSRIGYAMSENPSPEELEAGKAFLDGYRTRQKQLADSQVHSAGFMTADEVAVMRAIFK